ncbi:MAG: hypothetical protein ABI787_11085 [Spartobacteria bacterium]
MKQFFVLLGILMLAPSFTTQTNAAPVPQHREITVWITNPTGSLLGRGYCSTYLTNIRARTIGQDGPKLRNAVISLDGLGMLQVKGFGLVPAAVAWQSKLPMRKVIKQQAETGLSYGELLVANALASESGESFAAVVAQRGKTRTWGELATQLRVSPDLLITKVNTAAKRIVAVDFKSRRGPGRATNPAISSNNPHTQRARHL